MTPSVVSEAMAGRRNLANEPSVMPEIRSHHVEGGLDPVLFQEPQERGRADRVRSVVDRPLDAWGGRAGNRRREDDGEHGGSTS